MSTFASDLTFERGVGLSVCIGLTESTGKKLRSINFTTKLQISLPKTINVGIIIEAVQCI